ncbi:MAG: AI-2E family transporter [Actinobacteria bacterium]|nr:AI-2E family transporter [Actinomycetota bacterium]
MAEAQRDHVPWRIIFGTIFAVLAVGVGMLLLMRLTRILGLVVVAGFFALILGPPVEFLESRAHIRRGLATIIVVLGGLGLVAAMLYAFIRPIVDQTAKFVDDLPGYVDDAQAGRGAIGHLVKRYNIDDYVTRNQQRLKKSLTSSGRQVPHYVGKVASGVVATLTIFVLAFLMLLQGPRIQRGALQVIEPPRRRKRAAKVATDCARAVTGYMFGNLVISVIAGVVAYGWLMIIRVPFKETLGLWVAFADLIPLVGATLGAVPMVLVAFLHSVPAGIATIVFYIVYQQFENHVLQVSIMSKTVDLNPLTVLISILAGVELFGIIGALLAIPAAGVIQVIVRDIYDTRRGRLKPEPTVGVDEVPVSQADL